LTSYHASWTRIRYFTQAISSASQHDSVRRFDLPERLLLNALPTSYGHDLLGSTFMTEISPEQWLADRLRQAGIDPKVPIEYGAKPLIEHADRVDQPPQAWLERFEVFVRTLHSIPLDFWSPIHFCVPSLAGVAANRPETFNDLLRKAGELLAELHRHGVPLTRTEQYGIRISADALGRNDRALSAVFETGQRLAARGQDPGWLLQITVPELWNAAVKEEVLFCRWVQLVEATAAALADMGISVGYPFATGLAALAGHGALLREYLALWLEKIVQVSRSLVESSLQPYGWFEFGLVGLSPAHGFPAGSVTRALDIALNLADRGIHSGDLLQASFGLAGDAAPQTVDAFLGAAERLSRYGIDPFFVLTGGLAQNAALLSRGLDDADGLESVLSLAQQLHFQGRSLRKTFEDGLPVLRELEDRSPGLFRRGFRLAERLARAGIDPGMVLAFGMSRALAGADTRAWLETECISWAENLAAVGADPEPALSYAVPPMLDMAGTELEVFGKLRAALQDFIAMLAGFGIEYRDILFYDVSALAENQATESGAFIATLRRLGELVRLMVQFHRDPGPVMVSGLPAAARAGVRHSWVLEDSLDTSIRLAATGRDPRRFLEQAAGPLAEAAGEDREAFRQLCTVVEKRFQDVQDSDWSVVQAAASVSDGRAEWLNQALTAVLELLPGEHETENTRSEFMFALPQLVAMAEDPKGLTSIMQAFRSEASRFGGRKAAKGAWLMPGIETCAAVVGRDIAAGILLLHDLGRLSRTWDTLATSILRHGARAAAGIAGHDSQFFLDSMTACARAAGRLNSIGKEPNEALPRLVAVASAAGRARRNQWADALELLCEVLSRAGPDHMRLFDDLVYAEQLLERWGNTWETLIAPLLRAHGRYAGSLMYALTQAPSNMVRKASDLDVLRGLMTQTGVRALDIICNLIIPSVSRGIIQSLTDHRETLPGFVRDVGCWDADLYASYRQIVCNSALSALERRSSIAALRDGFTELTAAIRRGSVSQEQERHPHFTSAMAYVFPPSVSVTLQTYGQLYSVMVDRPQDVSECDPGPDLQQRVYALGRGSWQLRAGVTMNAAVWEPALTALRAAGTAGESIESSATLGWDLLRHWSEGRLARAEIKAVLWPRLLRFVRATGVHLPQEAGTAAQLQEIKRVFSDRLRDAIEEALLASRRADGERYDRMVKVKMNPKAQVSHALAKSVWRQIEAYRSRLIGAEEASRRLSHQLKGFVMEEDNLIEIMNGVESIDGVRTLLEHVGPRQTDPRSGREVQRVHTELAGQEVGAMRRELFGGPQRAALLEYSAASVELEITCEVTKRRTHAAVGLTEGVCVVTDQFLWNNPDFLQAVFWDPDGICRGGVHLLKAESGGNRYLTLPGINPSSYLLEMVEAQAVLDMVCDYAWRLARVWGLKGVWIPASPEIHSNRQAVRDEITRRRWETKSVRAITLSCEPFAYSFAEVLDIPQRVFW
jgi:hypothetical protein